MIGTSPSVLELVQLSDRVLAWNAKCEYNSLGVELYHPWLSAERLSIGILVLTGAPTDLGEG